MTFDQFSKLLDFYSYYIFFFAILAECLVSARAKKPSYRVNDTLVNLVTGLFALYLPYMAGIAILLVFYRYLHSFALFGLDPVWRDLLDHGQVHLLTFIALFFCDDLSYYAYHRASHEVRALWCIHEVHHSSEEYNFSVYFRASFVEYVFQGFFWIPMILLGFNLEDMIFQMGLSLFFQFWLHTRYTKRVPIFDRVFNVPRYHRVHHAKNIQYLDRNYGAILIIWDKLFGSFEEEREPPIFGVLSPPRSFNPIHVNTHAFQSLLHDFKHCKDGLLARFKYLIYPPGWRSDQTGSTTRILQAKYLEDLGKTMSLQEQSLLPSAQLPIFLST